MTELATLTATPHSEAKTHPALMPRPGLLERVHRAGAVSAIIAPPGFGKSALARQLAADRAGVSLVVAEDGLQPPRGETSSVMVVDEAHRWTADVLARWIDWATATGLEQLVLIGRPSLARTLRDAAGDTRLETIRADRLAFERDETRQFVDMRIAEPVPEEWVRELHALTAGWPALLDAVISVEETAESIGAILRADEPPGAAIRLTVETLLSELSEGERRRLGIASVLRRLEPQCLAAVLESGDDAAHLLTRLNEVDLLSTGVDGAPRLRAPWIRESLRMHLEQREPDRVQRAQLAAATFLESSGADWALPDVIAHYAAANRVDRAAAVLEQSADDLLERVAPGRALRWLSTLEGEAPPSSRARCLQARIYALLGQWTEAQQSLERLQQTALGEGDGSVVDFARVAWVQATMASQRGRISEANAYAQRALSALDEAGRGLDQLEADPIIFDLLRLQARLMVDAGKHDTAERALRQLIDRAEAAHRRRPQAAAHFALGKLALRTGDALVAVEHLTNALELVDRQSDSDLYNQIETCRAEAHLQRGEFEDAKSCVANALSVRRRMGQVPAVARSLVALAELRVASGDAETADPPFAEAMAIVDRGADAHLRAEVSLRYASYLVDTRRVGASIRQLERVREFVGDLRRLDPVLAALAETVRGRIARLQMRLGDARQLLERAAEAMTRQGNDYLASFAQVWLAETYWADPPNAEGAPRMRRHVDVACAIANRREYAFGQPDRYLPLVGSASALGSVEATQYIRRITGEAPPMPALEGLSLGQVGPRAPYRLFGPDGERSSTPEEVSEIIAGLPEDHLAIVNRDGRCDIHHRGHVQNGDLKRVVLPLLRVLMQHPGDGLSAPELAFQVWGEADFDSKARTRLKVAVSRLRELLGVDSKHLCTIPGTGPDRSANTRYALSRTLPFLWIEPLEA